MQIIVAFSCMIDAIFAPRQGHWVATRGMMMNGPALTDSVSLQGDRAHADHGRSAH